MLRRGFLLALAVLFVNHFINAQFATDYMVESTNTYIQSRAENTDTAGWVDFKYDEYIEPGVLFDSLDHHLGLGSNDSMILKSEVTDTLGFTHRRYYQEYKGVRVEDAALIEHIRDCSVDHLNGDVVENFDRSVSPSYSESSALETALNHLGYADEAWNRPRWEDSLKSHLNDPNATYYPDGRLILANANSGDLVPSNYELCWVFGIKAIDSDSVPHNHVVYVSADTGGVVKESRLVNRGTGETTLWGARDIDTKAGSGGNYQLKTNDKGRHVNTKDYQENGGNWVHWLAPHHKEADNYWEADEDRSATAHWVVTEAWDYYSDKFDREGFNDDEGKPVRVWSNYDPFEGDDGALYRTRDGGLFDWFSMHQILFTNYVVGEDGSYGATPDLAGHEYTHGVIDYTSDMDDDRENGALAESFSDIFGALVEKQALGSTDWMTAGDLFVNSGNLPSFLQRSLSNPSATDNAEEYGGANWVDADESNCPDPNESNNWCGIYNNAGVQNYWFYRLVTGLGIVNYNGIGTQRASRIAYRSMTKYMNSSSDYQDAREASIRAAKYLFGHCSEEHITTVNAWNKVNVGPSFNSKCVFINGYPRLCCQFIQYYTEIKFTATGKEGASFTWSNIPSTWTTHTEGSNNQHLIVDDFGLQQCPDDVTISVSSSNGGSDDFELNLLDCHTPKVCEESDTTSTGDGETSRLSKQRDELKLEIYPNPTKNELTVNTNSAVSEADIVILKTSGKIVDRYTMIETNSKQLKLNIQPGVYFLELRSKVGMRTKKLLITE